MDRLGTSFSPSIGFGDEYGPGVHAGAAHVRPLGFDSGCGCFRYVAPALRIR